MNEDFNLLRENQVFGSDQIDVIKKYGKKCIVTDFSILLGESGACDYFTSEDTKNKITGFWWVCDKKMDDYAYLVSSNGNECFANVCKRDVGIRPVLYCLESVESLSYNEIIDGEYPQTITDKDYSKFLEMKFKNKELEITGKEYTTDSINYRNRYKEFESRTHIEYIYNGKKYIRFVADENCNGKILSDGRRVETGNAYWVNVEPIIWLVDAKTNMLISEKILLSGIRFKDINQFLNEYFKNEISNTPLHTKEKQKKLVLN